MTPATGAFDFAVIPSVESRGQGGWGRHAHASCPPPTQVPRLTLGMTNLGVIAHITGAHAVKALGMN